MAEDRVLDGTPNDLAPFKDAYELKQKSKDEEMWRANQYTMMAVSVAVGRSLYGKKCKAKYLDKPMLMMEEEKQQKKAHEKQLTEAEKKRQREMLLMALQIREINFNNNKDKGTKGNRVES